LIHVAASAAYEIVFGLARYCLTGLPLLRKGLAASLGRDRALTTLSRTVDGLIPSRPLLAANADTPRLPMEWSGMS